jgi:hypothetical protein
MMNRIFKNESPRDIQLDLVIMRESTGDGKEMWVAQCLQYDITAQAETIEKLQCRFERILTGTIILALENEEEPFANLNPAPQRYWTQYGESKMTVKVFPVSVPPDRMPQSVSLPPSRIPRGQAVMKLSPAV